ncbi:MAG: hypothetical protein NDJ90_13095 [Oligoflexia bacterium]|nr:hypothetical protein [Oligoflexia bacterium]
MPVQVIAAFLIEVFLILLTLLLLLQPAWIFRTQSDRGRVFTTLSGWVFLCVTFCWSVVFGCVVALNRLTFQL